MIDVRRSLQAGLDPPRMSSQARGRRLGAGLLASWPEAAAAALERLIAESAGRRCFDWAGYGNDGGPVGCSRAVRAPLPESKPQFTYMTNEVVRASTDSRWSQRTSSALTSLDDVFRDEQPRAAVGFRLSSRTSSNKTLT